MRVLQLTSHVNVGGVTSYVLALSRELRRRGHEVVVASGGGELVSQAVASGLDHWRAPLRTKTEIAPQVWWARRQLLGRLQDAPVDVIHAHTRVAQVVAAHLSRTLRIPYVTTWHGWFRPNLGRRLWPCTGDVTIAISEPVRAHLLRDFHIAPAHVRLIPNGVDAGALSQRSEANLLKTSRQQWQLPVHGPIIGAVGRLASGGVKGYDVLLHAVSLLARDFPSMHVLLVGEGPGRGFLERLAQRLGITERVHFIGTVVDVRIPLALMDAFVFPSRWQEGFGLSLIEAMAAGKPVIASHAGATSTIIEHGRSGWLVPPEDPVALAGGIRALLSDPALAARLGGGAQARVHERFSLERMVEQIEQVYQEVVSQQRGSVVASSVPARAL